MKTYRNPLVRCPICRKPITRHDGQRLRKLDLIGVADLMAITIHALHHTAI